MENPPPPDITEKIAEFATPEFGIYYLQRLQAYFLATSDGSYNLQLDCEWECFLYIDDDLVLEDFLIG